MPSYKRIFVVEQGKYTTIRNEVGDEVSFLTLEDLMRCTGMDFTGKFYIGYEPEINFFSDSEDPSVSSDMIPHSPYEWIIDNISVLKTRQDDKTYGLTGDALKQAQYDVAVDNIRTTFAQDSEAPVLSLGYTWNGGQDSASYIQGAVTLAQSLGETSVNITDIDNVTRELTFEQALQVATDVGLSFRTAFFNKQNALVAAMSLLN